MTTMRHLATLTWDTVPRRPLVLVPVGSTEQHGPHLPFETDTLIATASADRIAQALEREGIEVVVAPAIAYGASGEHQGFPGTVSVGREALRMQIVELVRSLSTWAGRIVFINGHGGNVSTLTSAITQMRQEQHDVAWIACMFEPEGDAHAGSIETSVMLHIAPERVDMSKAAPGQLAPLAQILPVLIADVVLAASPSGVLGDPTTATAEHGRELLAQLVADGAAFIISAIVDEGGRFLAPELALR